MAYIEEKAAALNMTVNVYVRGSISSRRKRYTITLTTSTTNNLPTVGVAIMGLGASVPTHFGGVDIEVRRSIDVMPPRYNVLLSHGRFTTV